jgi:YHS domain-containing protein
MGHPDKHLETWQSVDPVCAMTVSKKSEYRYQHDGTEYRFCSDSCKQKFTTDPTHYLHDPATDQVTGHYHKEDQSCATCDSVDRTCSLPSSTTRWACRWQPVYCILYSAWCCHQSSRRRR